MTQTITHTLVQSLRDVTDFSELDDDTLLVIVGASVNLLWAADEMIFEPGSPAEGLFVVLSGRIQIEDSDGAAIAEIGPGDYFGEHALLLLTSRTKAARAVEDAELMVIPQEALQPLLSSNPELAQHFRRKLESRLAENRES